MWCSAGERRWPPLNTQKISRVPTTMRARAHPSLLSLPLPCSPVPAPLPPRARPCPRDSTDSQSSQLRLPLCSLIAPSILPGHVEHRFCLALPSKLWLCSTRTFRASL